MIAIYAEKPDMGTKIAAALFGIPLENGVVVTFSQLENTNVRSRPNGLKMDILKSAIRGRKLMLLGDMGICVRSRNFRTLIYGIRIGKIFHYHIFQTIMSLNCLATIRNSTTS